MNLYKTGVSVVVGAEPPPKKGGWGTIVVVLGLLGVVYVAIPGRKGWQRALGDGK